MGLADQYVVLVERTVAFLTSHLPPEVVETLVRLFGKGIAFTWLVLMIFDAYPMESCMAVLGLIGAYLGVKVYIKSREKTHMGDEFVTARENVVLPTWFWWLLPLLFGAFGGLISWWYRRKVERRAWKYFAFGIGWTFVANILMALIAVYSGL